MSSIAIITARGGSKRIPRKNIKHFLGKPIIAYSIEAAINSECFDEVMVSTDDMEIANIARQYGAVVPFLRSDQTSSDFATTADAIEEVINNYKRINKSYDSFMCIYPTAPFLTAQVIKRAFDVFAHTGVNCVVPIVKYNFPPQRAFLLRDGVIKCQYPDLYIKRSQDLEPIFHDCGQFYLCNTEKFLEYKTVILPETAPIIMEDMEVQDIDTIADWEMAEIKYKIMRGKE